MNAKVMLPRSCHPAYARATTMQVVHHVAVACLTITAHTTSLPVSLSLQPTKETCLGMSSCLNQPVCPIHTYMYETCMGKGFREKCVVTVYV